MASLDSVRPKIDHAKLHLKFAKSEINRYLDANPGEFVAHVGSTPNNPTFVLKSKTPIPDKIGLIVGDCLQNLRSSLDYLIWELVLVAPNTPNKKNMFPVCLDLKSFQDAQRAGRLQGIDDPAAVALIDAFQPYRDGQPDATSLAILDKLTNINKHRRLILSELSSFSKNDLFKNWDAWVKSGSVDLTTLAHDTGIGKVFTSEQMKVQGDLIPFIAFNEGAVKDMEVGFALEAFVNYLSILVDRFEVFFP
jgi:hypothetical protein